MGERGTKGVRSDKSRGAIARVRALRFGGRGHQPGADSRIKLCILYGSAASGTLTKRNDIAIAGESKFDKVSLADLQTILSHKLGYEVDLVNIKRAENLIMREILKGGIVRITKDTRFYAECIKKVIYFNEDVLRSMRMILRKRARRFTGGH